MTNVVGAASRKMARHGGSASKISGLGRELGVDTAFLCQFVEATATDEEGIWFLVSSIWYLVRKSDQEPETVLGLLEIRPDTRNQEPDTLFSRRHRRTAPLRDQRRFATRSEPRYPNRAEWYRVRHPRTRTRTRARLHPLALSWSSSTSTCTASLGTCTDLWPPNDVRACGLLERSQ